MRGAVPMVEIRRGDRLESLHTGHAVIAGPDGEIVESWGLPETTIFPRSSIKMIQALPLLESGAGDGLSTERLALACASHQGEQGHVDAVAHWLSDIELSEDDLICGPQNPRDEAHFHKMIRSGEPVRRLHNNCSGKHAGFLQLSKHLGADLNYVDLGHPVQRAVRAAFEEVTGETSPGHGIDGCSAPNYATSVTGLARAMARFATAGEGDTRGRAMVALRNAMMAHPWLVGGTDRACTLIMEACEGRAVVKTGAEAVYTAILPQSGRGIALKIADGSTRGSEIAIVALLIREGVLDPEHPVAKTYMQKPIRNWDGLLVGLERPDPEFATWA